MFSELPAGSDMLSTNKSAQIWKCVSVHGTLTSSATKRAKLERAISWQRR